MPRATKPKKAAITPSASGGPSVFRGLEYQTRYAVLKALELISEVIYAPLRQVSITLEPRLLHETGVTRWDIEMSPPLVAIEAKANASKEDLIEFLQRVNQASGLDKNCRLYFVYGKCSIGLLASAMRLAALAIECGIDRDKFHNF